MCIECISLPGCFPSTVFALLSLRVLLLDPPNCFKCSDASPGSDLDKPHQDQPEAFLHAAVTTPPTATLKAPSQKKLKKCVAFKEDTLYLIPTRAEIFSATLKTSLWYNSDDISEFEKAAVIEVRHFMARNALNDFHVASILYFRVCSR